MPYMYALHVCRAQVLLDALEHSTEASERRENIQLIIDTIHTSAPVNLGSVFVTSTYKLHTDTLNARAELLAHILKSPLYSVCA